jgi:MFS family permease
MHASSEAVGHPKITAATRAAFAALLLGMLMAQLDTMVVVAALPSIGTDLGALDAIAGVTAAYLLTVTVSTPVHGKLGDLLGRRAVFVGSVLLFAAGSVLCALAPSLPILIAARAVQGIGGGGLVVTAVSALAEMFDRAELIRRQIWLTGTFAISALAGPPLGGLLAAGPGWEWIFLVNLPVCAIALALGIPRLPSRRRGSGLAGFDLAGTALIVVAGSAVVSLGSAADLAGSPIWAPLLLAVTVLAAVAFVQVERRAAAPVIPPLLLAVPALARSISATGLTGIALFGTFTFIPLAVATGTGADTAGTATLLLALTGGQLLVILTFSVLARRWARMVAWGRLGLAMGIVGLALLAALPHLRPAGPVVATATAVAGMALAGAALGLSMQAYTLLGQASAPRDSIGATMATLTFARQLGGSLGAAALGWLLLTITDQPTALTVVLTAAAAALTVGLLAAPRRHHEDALTSSQEPQTEASPPSSSN